MFTEQVVEGKSALLQNHDVPYRLLQTYQPNFLLSATVVKGNIPVEAPTLVSQESVIQC